MAHWMLGEFRFHVDEPYTILEESNINPRYDWYRFRVDVVVEFKGAEYLCAYTGSAHDYAKSIKPDEREVVECIIHEIMEAYTGPVEFMEMVFMEPPKDVEFIKTIYDLLMYADEYGKELEDLLPGDWWEEEEIAGRITEVAE